MLNCIGLNKLKENWEAEDAKIVTREDKKKRSAASKRGFYKKVLKRSSATDDIDSITTSKEK